MNDSVIQRGMIRPERREKAPPCGAECVAGGNPRSWIGIIAQRAKLGLSDHEAYRRAWDVLAAVNPFPATMGRVCPHPCESQCSRADKDGAVAVNALERFLGDWALAHRLALPRLAEPGSRPESIGVIGAGPAGLSFAYQMARRGYPVTVYEREARAGGMLYHGIPQYRLPEDVLAGEVARILDLGVALRPNTVVGRDVPLEALRAWHDVLFLGIGAGRGLTLHIPGEDGAGTWAGISYLAAVKQGATIDLGAHVVVVGGGNTAVDAARTARRVGAEVTLLYRRTRAEMPAIEGEVDDALEEGVTIDFLTRPVEIRRQDGVIRSVLVQQMALGDPDGSGRRAPVPVTGSEYEVPATAVLMAVSQQPDWEGLEALKGDSAWVDATAEGERSGGMWAGGDCRALGVAGGAIAQGRRAAEAAHVRFGAGAAPPLVPGTRIAGDTVKPDFYAAQERVTLPRRSPRERVAMPDAEVQGTITEDEFLVEASRCFSCGLCYGCEQCFMYCNAEGVRRVEHAAPGEYFALCLERCRACGKCIDLCPCGFLSPGDNRAPV